MKYRKPYRIKKKKPILKNRFFLTGILSLIILGGFFYFFFLSDVFQIKKIIITGEQKVSKDDIKLVVESGLEKKILFFETKSIFLVDLNKIREDVLNKFPQIGEIEISQGLPDALNLIVIERKEVGIFCRDAVCFLLDGEGIIFENATGSPQLLKIQNLLFNEELKLGERAVDKELLSKITEVNQKLKNDFKIPLEEVSIISDDRVNFKNLEGWEIYFDPQKDLDWQFTKLRAVLDEEIPLEKRGNLEYIELRFGNLASYKYR